jgi:hypothetical protein
MPKKIFIVGRNRSGTKWLSNIIANHRAVSAVQREGAGGILESNLLRNYPKYFNLQDIEERTAFEILFRESNFHRCSEMPDTELEIGNYRDFYDFFERYMNKIALNKNTEFWLQKVGSLELPVLMEKFEDAKFIIIQRHNIADNVLSSIFLNNPYASVSFRKFVGSIIDYWRHNKTENRFKHNKNVLIISYEDLKNDTILLSEKICDFIGIKFYQDIINVTYKPNTSFKQKKREDYYTTKSVIIIKILSFCISVCPLYLLNFIQRKKRLSLKMKFFQPLTFELYRNEGAKVKSRDVN